MDTVRYETKRVHGTIPPPDRKTPGSVAEIADLYHELPPVPEKELRVALALPSLCVSG